MRLLELCIDTCPDVSTSSTSKRLSFWSVAREKTGSKTINRVPRVKEDGTISKWYRLVKAPYKETQTVPSCSIYVFFSTCVFSNRVVCFGTPKCLWVTTPGFYCYPNPWIGLCFDKCKLGMQISESNFFSRPFWPFWGKV